MLLNDSTRRAIRTGIDSVVALLVTLGAVAAALASMGEQVELFGVDPGQILSVGAVLAAVTVAVNKVKNALEDTGFIPPLLKAPPAGNPGNGYDYDSELERLETDYVAPPIIPENDSSDNPDRGSFVDPDDFPEEKP